jgi:hypothetical protein
VARFARRIADTGPVESLVHNPADRGKGRNESGVSLVEIMMGAACVVIFLGATLGLVNQHSHQRQLNREIALAANAAGDKIESLRNLDFTLMPAQNGTGFDVPSENGGPHGLNVVPGDADGLCGSLTVTVAQSLGTYVLYRVTAQIAWQGVSGVRTFSLQTLMGRRR